MPSAKVFLSKKGRLCVKMGETILIISKVKTKAEEKELYCIKMAITTDKTGNPKADAKEEMFYSPGYFLEPEQFKAFIMAAERL